MGSNFQRGDEPVPGYQLEKFLGQGAFGQVWKVLAPGGTEAALKIINLSGKQGLKEFRALRLVKLMRHPNLVPIVAYWLKDEQGYLLNEAAVGGEQKEPQQPGTLSLADFADRRPVELLIAMGLGEQDLGRRLDSCQQDGLAGIPVQELLGYMEDAARAIDYLNNPHNRGSQSIAVQHCDIKPANIMIVGGAAQVCDFGLARMLGDVRKTATTAGTIAYVAPECLKTCEPSATTDQYSLAITYYELRTGKLPYSSEVFTDVVTAVMHGTLDFSQVSPAEEEVIRRATAFDPAERYPSVGDMVRVLRQAVEDPASIPIERAGSRTRRRLPWGRAALITAMAVICLAAWSQWPSMRRGFDEWFAGGEPPAFKPQEREAPPTTTVANVDSVRQAPEQPAAPKEAAASRPEPKPLPPAGSQQTPAKPPPATAQTAPSPAPKPAGEAAREAKPDPLAPAQKLFDQEKFDDAIALLTTAIKSAPRPSFDAYLLRGTCYLEKQDYKAAVADFTQAIDIDGKNVRALSRRATAQLRAGDSAAAIADFTRSIDLQPDARDFIGRGVARWNQGADEPAIADFSEAIRLAPDSSDGYFKRALVYFDEQQWPKSRDDFESALRRAPDDPDVLSNFARLLATATSADVRDGKRAVLLATQACALSAPAGSDSMDVLGAAYAEAGQFDRAIDAAEQAIRDEQDPALREDYRARLALYRQNRPYRIAP